MRAQGSTALWDAVVYGLYQYQGVRGRKAYVILTDGEDRSSKFPFEAALDYAKKSGVALYFIGLRIPRLAARGPARSSAKLARETGGTVYYVNAAQGLARIYAEINEELRSQYLLTYLPQNKTPGNQWRKIEVKMTPVEPRRPDDQRLLPLRTGPAGAVQAAAGDEAPRPPPAEAAG